MNGSNNIRKIKEIINRHISEMVNIILKNLFYLIDYYWWFYFTNIENKKRIENENK